MRTRRLTLGFVALSVFGAAGTASAQQLTNLSAGYAGLPVRPYAPAETGVVVSDGVYLHAGVGAEMGYDSNVFFQDTNLVTPVSSPILRVVPFLEINNQIRGAGPPPRLYFNLGAHLQYRHYFSDNPAIGGSDVKDSFSPSVSGLLDFSQGQTFGLSLSDTFSRTEEPPYFAGAGPIVRVSNLGSVQGRYSPGGGRIQAMLRYSNRLDLFETTTGAAGVTSYRFGNSMTHEGLFDLSWRWLPKTALFVATQLSRTQYLEDDPGIVKSDSTQLRVLGGLRGLITARLSIAVALGYGKAFYENDVNPSGFGTLAARVDLTYRPTPLTGLTFGYLKEFQNSIIGNFYNVDGLSASLTQLIAGRITASAFARYEYRRFFGAANDATSVAGRKDHLVMAGAASDYYLRRWAYVGVGYSLFFNDSNASLVGLGPGGTAGTANYIKHQVFARVGFTY